MNMSGHLRAVTQIVVLSGVCWSAFVGVTKAADTLAGGSLFDNARSFNRVNAGRAVPVKFSLNGFQGAEIFAFGSPSSAAVDCGAGQADAVEPLETTSAGASSVTYDVVSDQYVYVWKTDRTWAGTCRQLTVKLKDGSIHVANFDFR